MNLQINNVATLPSYDPMLTLGPDEFEALTVNVWNNSCVSQVFELGPGGDWQTGNWADESLEAANSTFTLQRAGGVRFRDNPDTPGVHARIVAIGIKAGGVQKVGGNQLQGTIAATGAVTPTGGLITGIIPATGNTQTAGTGFTYAHTNGTGVYAFTFSTPFNAAPTIVATVNAGTDLGIWVTAISGSGFTVNTSLNNGVATDEPFSFVAIPTA